MRKVPLDPLMHICPHCGQCNYCNCPKAPVVGTEIYFVGDEAYTKGFGRIIAVHQSEMFIPKMYDIQMEDGRSMAVAFNAFDPKLGRKWWTRTEWEDKT